MVEYYGDWQQGPDYTRTQLTGLTAGWEMQGARDQQTGPAFSYDGGLWNAAVGSAANPTGFGPEVLGAAQVTGSYDPEFGGVSTYNATAGCLLRAVSAHQARQSWPRPPLPDDAVDVEWEAPGSTVVKAVAAPGFFHRSQTGGGAWAVLLWALRADGPGLDVDLSADPPVLATPWHAGQAFTAAGDLTAPDPSVAALVAAWPPRADGTPEPVKPLDVTAHLAGDDAVLALLVWVRVDAIPAPQAGSPGANLGATVGAYDWFANVTWTLRPPRHRFVYERVPQPPITRVHPRDDGRGTSAAGRVWPPPRSQQGSPRVGPGSYH